MIKLTVVVMQVNVLVCLLLLRVRIVNFYCDTCILCPLQIGGACID